MKDGVALRFGGERGVGTGRGDVEVRADDEAELPQVGAQYRGRLLGGSLADPGVLDLAGPAQLDLAGLPARCGPTRPPRTGPPASGGPGARSG